MFDDRNGQLLRGAGKRIGVVVKNTGRAVVKLDTFSLCAFHSALVGNCFRRIEAVKFDDDMKEPLQPKLSIISGTSSFDKTSSKDVLWIMQSSKDCCTQEKVK